MPYKDPKKNAECKRKWREAHKDYHCESNRRRYRERKKFHPHKHKQRINKSSIGNVCRALAKNIGCSKEFVEEWREITFNQQNGRCAICGVFERELDRILCIDHDHKTGKLRGLLCHNCNAGIGLFNDDPSLCYQARMYLKRHKE
jgi:hypothetical protein